MVLFIQHMHGLSFDVSIYYWQNQPDISLTVCLLVIDGLNLYFIPTFFPLYERAYS